MGSLAVDDGAPALRATRQHAQIRKLRLRAEVANLEPVVGNRVVPANVAAPQDLVRLRDRAGEAVTRAGVGDRVVEVRGEEVGDDDSIDGIGELRGLTGVA